MFGRTPKLPLDIDLGIPMVEQEPTSHQNYAQKLHCKLQWAYQKPRIIIRESQNAIKGTMVKG